MVLLVIKSRPWNCTSRKEMQKAGQDTYEIDMILDGC